jgi:3-oxoacyl-[acyl-carrier protein] reductase
MSLDRRVAIVTGAGRGIGRATAARLAREGAAVVANDIDEGPVGETVDLIVGQGGRAIPVVADTVDAAAAASLVATAVDTFGQLDILVNIAGITRDAMFHKMSEELLDIAIDVNLRTGFHASLAAMPYLREAAKREIAEMGRPRHHRKIVFMSSASALIGNPGQFNYVATKGALIAATRTMARELAPFAINVNAVAPGFIDTRLTQVRGPGDDHGIPEGARRALIEDIPMGRPGTADEVASVIAFLVSPDADYVTGITLPVAGGMVGTM